MKILVLLTFCTWAYGANNNLDNGSQFTYQIVPSYEIAAMYRYEQAKQKNMCSIGDPDWKLYEVDFKTGKVKDVVIPVIRSEKSLDSKEQKYIIDSDEDVSFDFNDRNLNIRSADGQIIGILLPSRFFKIPKECLQQKNNLTIEK